MAPELATRAFLLQLALRYKHKAAFGLYHVNDFGGIDSPDKARDAKMTELDIVERGVYNARDAANAEFNASAADRARLADAAPGVAAPKARRKRDSAKARRHPAKADPTRATRARPT